MMHACTLWALSIQKDITNATVVDQIYNVPSTSSGSAVIHICIFLASETVCLSHRQNIHTSTYRAHCHDCHSHCCCSRESVCSCCKSVCSLFLSNDRYKYEHRKFLCYISCDSYPQSSCLQAFHPYN